MRLDRQKIFIEIMLYIRYTIICKIYIIVSL